MRKSKRNYKQLSSDLNSLSISSPAHKEPSKRPKRSAKPPPAIKELEDVELFTELSKPKPNIPDCLSILESQIKDHHDIVLRNFLILFLKLLGLENLASAYEEIDALKLDLKELSDRVHGCFEMLDSPPVIPILGGGKSKNLIKNLGKFLDILFTDNEMLLYKTKLFACVFAWLQTFSLSSVRLVRLGVLELLMLLLRNSLELMEKLDEELERLKGLDSDKEKMKAVELKLEYITRFLYETVEQIVFPRQKDCRSEVREKYVDIMELLILKSPKNFLKVGCLSALMELLFRKEELENIKSQIMTVFIKLYDPENLKFSEWDRPLENFLNENDFAKKVLCLALNPNLKSSNQALQLVINIDKKFAGSPISDDFSQIHKLVFLGTKESRTKTAHLMLKDTFESFENLNSSVQSKITSLIEKLLALEGDKFETNKKFELFLTEGTDYLISHTKPGDWLSFFIDKNVIRNNATVPFDDFLLFQRVLLENTRTIKPEFLNEFSNLILTNLEPVLNKLKRDSESFTQFLKTLSLFEISCFSAPETLDSIKLLIKAIKTALGFMKDLEFYSETLSLMTSFSKVSSHLKDLAEGFINKLVKEELEAFQGSFLQVFRNQLSLDLLAVKSELFSGLKLELQRLGMLLKGFRVPALLEEEFLMQINEGCQKKFAEDLEGEEQKEEEKERSEIVALFLGIMGLAHYWLLREIFQDPDDIQNYNFYLKFRNQYVSNLTNILSHGEKSHPLLPHTFELAVSFVALVSNDKMSKLKGIYLAPNEDLFRHMLSFIEFCIKNKNQYDVFPHVFTLFSEPFESLKIMMSIFGKSFMKNAFANALWGKSKTPTLLLSTLKNLKETESLPQNKSTLTFWRMVQDLLFEVVNDHALSNTEQSELGQFISRTVLKVYFTSLGSQKDSVFLEKYVVFLADTLVRGFENTVDLLSFSFLNSLIYKPVLEQEHAKKLRDFFRLEKRKTEDGLKSKGKSLDKMENYSFLEKFEASLEKLTKDKPGKEKKSKDKHNELVLEEEENKNEILASKRKEIQEELEKKRKEVKDDDDFLEDEETLNVLEENRSGRPKRKTQKKKVK